MRIVAIASGILVLFAAAMTYNIWHASNDPVTSTPGPLETGRTKLHQQLEEAKKTEAQVEKEAWDSAPALRGLIKGSSAPRSSREMPKPRRFWPTIRIRSSA
jgi:hypothetical protein